MTGLGADQYKVNILSKTDGVALRDELQLYKNKKLNLRL